MKLRWYQDEAVDSIWQYYADGGTGNPVVALPTGTGKSVVIGDFVCKMVTHYPGRRMIKLTHRKELIQQNFNKLLSIWPLAPAGIYSAGLGRREHAHPITFAGIGSVARKAKLFGWIDDVIIDECHLLGPKDSTQYRQFIGELKRINPDLHVIGLTATPYRLGQGLLTEPGSLFTDICYNLTTYESFQRLIAEGFLSPLVPRPSERSETSIDLSSVGTCAGDYNQKQLQEAVDRDSITRAAIEEIIFFGEERRHWLIFAAGVEHSEHISDVLNELGIPTIAIHSKMAGGDAARDAGIRGWMSGRYRCAVNNDVLTTGIDFPGIDLIGHLQPTKSTVKWVQGLGRGTRPYEGKENCLVLDFAGNTQRLGPIDDPLLPRPKGQKGKGEAPVKLCPACNTWNHTSVRFCTSCGQEFVAQVKIEERASSLKVMGREDDEGPKLETFVVNSVEYEPYHSVHSGRSLKVFYFCDSARIFSEYIALEHEKPYVRHKARDWWRARTGEEPPETVHDALDPVRLAKLATPTHIQVWVNKMFKSKVYPEVMAYCYDGSGFGKDN